MTDQHITALVTGANRGLGERFATQLVEARREGLRRRTPTRDNRHTRRLSPCSSISPIQSLSPRAASLRGRRQRLDQQRGGFNEWAQLSATPVR